nr:MAG TPA: hypothetical protein [Bacteriophage sp.]
MYVGGQKIKEIYISTEKVYGGKTVTEYYFRNQEDIKRALKDQTTNLQEGYVRLVNNRMATQYNKFFLPVGISNPKIIEIKGVIKNSRYGYLPLAHVGF